jgi:hypothetical protein
MSIQTIVDRAQAIEFDRRAIVAQSVSRSQRVKTAERNSGQPLQMTVTPPGMLRYSTSRGIIEDIMTTDRVTEVKINLANNTKLKYLTALQGDLNYSQVSAMTITNFTSTSITLGGLPAIGAAITTSTVVASDTVIFKPGDYIQPAGSRYPYIITNTVLRGTNSVVTATTHRNLITSEATTLTGAILVGNTCTFQMIVLTLPTYKLVSNDRVQFTGDFTLVEKII